MLKSDLHTVIKHDLDWPVDLFRRHSYPAVSDSRRVDLLRELNDIVRVRSGLLPHYNHKMLEGILRMAERWEGLPFLESEAPHVLIDEFSMFYIKRICLFKNSAHIFDAEDTIRARLSAEPLLDDGRPLRNFRFADSKSEPGIQIADVVTGLLGKFFTFVSRTPPEELQDLLPHPSANQSQNLALLANLVERSIAENAAFASYVMSNDDRHGCAILLGG